MIFYAKFQINIYKKGKILKIILIFILIMVNSLFANEILHQENNLKKGCTIPFFETNKINCSKQIEGKAQNSKSKRKEQLREILNKIKRYKEKTENEKEQLQKKLDIIEKEFKRYKAKKKREIVKINTQLRITRKKLLKNKKKLYISQKYKKTIPRKIVRKKTIPRKIVRKKTTPQKIVRKKATPQKIVRNKIFPKRKVLREKVIIQRTTPLPAVNNLPWVEIVVEDNINIYQLALKYYGDKTKYREIYAANQHIIGKNLKIYNGMSLKIPMTNQFEEQPMILNTN